MSMSRCSAGRPSRAKTPCGALADIPTSTESSRARKDEVTACHRSPVAGPLWSYLRGASVLSRAVLHWSVGACLLCLPWLPLLIMATRSAAFWHSWQLGHALPRFKGCTSTRDREAAAANASRNGSDDGAVTLN